MDDPLSGAADSALTCSSARCAGCGADSCSAIAAPNWSPSPQIAPSVCSHATAVALCSQCARSFSPATFSQRFCTPRCEAIHVEIRNPPELAGCWRYLVAVFQAAVDAPPAPSMQSCPSAPHSAARERGYNQSGTLAGLCRATGLALEPVYRAVFKLLANRSACPRLSAGKTSLALRRTASPALSAAVDDVHDRRYAEACAWAATRAGAVYALTSPSLPRRTRLAVRPRR